MKNGLPEIKDLKNFRCEVASDTFWGFEASGEWNGVEYWGVASTKEGACESLLFFASEKIRREFSRQNTEHHLKIFVSQGIIDNEEYQNRMIMEYGVGE